MNDGNVRLATTDDLEQIAGLYKNSFPEHIMVHRGFLSNPDYIATRLTNPDELWVVNSTDRGLKGVAALAIAPPVGLGEIERVCVAREYRGNGVAHDLCSFLVDEAKKRDLGFVEAFARGNQPSMQMTFAKLGFKIYGIAPRFEVIHDNKEIREQFVHMGLELKPETVDEGGMQLIPNAAKMYEHINSLR